MQMVKFLLNLVNDYFNENDFLKLEEIEKEIILTNMRIKVLRKLEVHGKNKEIQEYHLEDLQKIKNNNSLFNTIFKLKEYDLIISENVFNKLNKDYLTKILINVSKILSLKESDKEIIDINRINADQKNDLIISKATSERKLQSFFDKYFNKIMKILIAKKDFELMEIFAESILRFISNKEIPMEYVKNIYFYFSCEL